MTQWAAASVAVPAAMNAARNTIAPRIPQNSSRCWYAAGTAKAANSRENTNTLSTESESSIR